MNAEAYQRHLHKYKEVLQNHLFQQDHASPHKKTVNDGFFETHGIRLPPWEAHSPDLNVGTDVRRGGEARCG